MDLPPKLLDFTPAAPKAIWHELFGNILDDSFELIAHFSYTASHFSLKDPTQPSHGDSTMFFCTSDEKKSDVHIPDKPGSVRELEFTKGEMLTVLDKTIYDCTIDEKILSDRI